MTHTHSASGKETVTGMKARTLHGNAVNRQAYAYNIRGWLTNISGNRFMQNLYYETGSGTPAYNGNISSMTWRAGSEGTMRGYKFAYDGLDRLENATYGEGMFINANTGRFSENVTNYDLNGNITSLQRYGQTGSSYGLVDDLTFTLNGNRLDRVDDTANGGLFGDAVKQSGEYAYDENGNMAKDLNKNISEIEYNCLNLPGKVTFTDGSTIAYTYAADGTKLGTVRTIGGATTTTDYCGNAVYENGTLKYLLTDEGYITPADGKYHYYLTDHLGNNRVIVGQTGNVEEVNHYYPFGGMFASTDVQPYKYNGKEWDEDARWYDYGARNYDAAVGRFTTNDLLSEKYFPVSPYVYCLNNPILFIDLYGTDVKPYSDEELSMIRNTLSKKEQAFIMLDQNGYIDKKLINSYDSENGNYNALKELVNSNFDIFVKLDDEYEYKDNSGEVQHKTMSYFEPDEYLADKNIESPNGLTTGEGGNNGITLLPGKGKSGVNSIRDGEINIIVNKNLSETGRAETYSHEANGHALMYVRTGDRHKAAHNAPDWIELNTPLRNMIIKSRKETIKNLMER